MYSQEVLDHFHNPRNVGELEEPSAVVTASNPICGDTLKLWIRVVEGRVVEARFKVQGCVPAVACGSWLTEAIRGKTVTELEAINSEQIETAMGGLPAASRHASMLAVTAVRETIEKLRHGDLPD